MEKDALCLKKQGSSETTRADFHSKNKKCTLLKTLHFNSWLSGLIDGDGYLGARRLKKSALKLRDNFGRKITTPTLPYKRRKGKKTAKGLCLEMALWRLHKKPLMRTVIHRMHLKLLLNQSLSFRETYWTTGFFEAPSA